MSICSNKNSIRILSVYLNTEEQKKKHLFQKINLEKVKKIWSKIWKQRRLLPISLDVQSEIACVGPDLHRRVLRLAGGAVALKDLQGVMLRALLQKAVDHRAEDKQGCRCQHVGVVSAKTQRERCISQGCHYVHMRNQTTVPPNQIRT